MRKDILAKCHVKHFLRRDSDRRVPGGIKSQSDVSLNTRRENSTPCKRRFNTVHCTVLGTWIELLGDKGSVL